jgi:hypothetical protein
MSNHGSRSMNSGKKSALSRGRVALFCGVGLIVVLLAGFVGVRAWFNAFLHSEEFRRLISSATAGAVNADGEFRPFEYSGTTIYSDRFEAHGHAGSAFAELRADQIRAEFNLRGIFHHAWQIDEIKIGRVAARIERAAQTATQPNTAPLPNSSQPSSIAETPIENPKPVLSKAEGSKIENPSSGWLPNRVELHKAVIDQADLKWLESDPPQRGSIEGTRVTVLPDGAAWNVTGEGGRVRQAGFPDLNLDHLKLRYQQPSLFVTEGEFRNPESGSVAVTGEINFDRAVDLQVRLNGVPVTPFLTPDWRARLKGSLTGDMKVHGPLPATAPMRIEGSLSLAQGQLLALPVLDQIALFTGTQQFRTLALSRASARFTHDGAKLVVTNFVAESERLIRIEGDFVVENSNIDGNFQVGVTPASLQWLPGSQSKVFTVSRDGYLWTPMRLTGPLSNPTDDLRPRLIAAAGGAVIEGVQGTIDKATKDLPGTLEKKKKDILDLITPFVPQL